MTDSNFKEKAEFAPNKEGLLFVGKPADNGMDFDLEVLWLLDMFAKSYLIFCQEGVKFETDPDIRRRQAFCYMQLEESLKKCKEFEKKEPNVLHFGGFTGIKSEVQGYASYASDDILCIPPIADTLNIFLQKFEENRASLKKHNKLIQRILPYATCCASDIDTIKERMPFLIKNALESLTLDGEDENPEFPFPYAVSVSVTSNEALAGSKEEIVSKLSALIGERTKEFKHDASLATCSPKNYGPQTTVCFHVTVVGTQTYLGILVNPDKRNGYYL